MAKRVKNKIREDKKLFETRVRLVDGAMEDGYTTRHDIAEATGLKLWDISNLFTKNRDLYAKFCIRRKTIKDRAADNIQKIIEDPSHPQHFQASKFILTTYKSDLDEILESQDAESIIEIEGGDSGASPMIIRFGKKKTEKEEE